jgi:hypothetical protein
MSLLPNLKTLVKEVVFRDVLVVDVNQMMENVFMSMNVA